MAHPPRIIELVMRAVCVLLNVEPVFTRLASGEYGKCYWTAAIGPKVLGDP